MLKFLGKLLHFFWRLSGAEQILQQLQQLQQLLQLQQQLEQELQQKLLLLGNGLKYFFTDQEKLKASTTYKCCSEIVSLLSPMDIEGAKYIRVGRNCDGGYVMADNLDRDKVEAAYSFGIGEDVSWDEGVACRGIDVFMYDHTIKRLPKENPKFHYFKVGVTGLEKGTNLKTLSELIAENNHTACKNLVMKMDIEGCEWDVFRETPSTVISQFSQLIVEFHGFLSAVYGSEYDIITDVLKKINRTHQIVHLHGNNWDIPLWIGELVLPSTLEVTYVRRTDFKNKLVASTRQFPTSIDRPNRPGWPDIYMDSFFIDVVSREK